MVNEWTRDDLPSVGDILDAFVHWNADPGPVTGHALDAVVEHLNANGGLSTCGETIDALIRNRDALVENRDQSISSLQRLLATAEAERDRWRRAHEIVEGERDQARASLHEACKVAQSYKVDAYQATERAEAAEGVNHDQARLIEATRAWADAWKARAEAAEARTAPAVSRADVAETLSRCLNPEMWNVTFPSVVSEVCDLFGVETEQAADPVEVKAQELCREAFPDHGWGNAPWDTEDYWLPIENGFRRLAAHVLRQEAGR